MLGTPPGAYYTLDSGPASPARATAAFSRAPHPQVLHSHNTLRPALLLTRAYRITSERTPQKNEGEPAADQKHWSGLTPHPTSPPLTQGANRASDASALAAELAYHNGQLLAELTNLRSGHSHQPSPAPPPQPDSSGRAVARRTPSREPHAPADETLDMHTARWAAAAAPRL